MKVSTVFLLFVLLSVMLPFTSSSILSSAGKNDKDSRGNGHDSSRNSEYDSGSRSGSKPYQPPVVTPPIVKPVNPPVIRPPVVTPTPVIRPPVVVPPVVVNPPTVRPPVIVTPTPVWTVVNNYRNDQRCVLAANYLTTTYTIFRTVTIIQVSTQVLNGNRFKFLVQYPYASSYNSRSEIIVQQSLTGVYSIVGNSFVGVPSFNSAQLVTKPYSNVQYFNDVNKLLQKNLGTRLGVNPSVLDVSVNYPYYSVNYLCDQNRSVRANFSYDPIIGNLNVIDVKESPYRK